MIPLSFASRRPTAIADEGVERVEASDPCPGDLLFFSAARAPPDVVKTGADGTLARSQCHRADYRIDFLLAEQHRRCHGMARAQTGCFARPTCRPVSTCSASPATTASATTSGSGHWTGIPKQADLCNGVGRAAGHSIAHL